MAEVDFAGGVDLFGSHRFARVGHDVLYCIGNNSGARFVSSGLSSAAASARQQRLAGGRELLKLELRVRECSV